MPEVAINCPVVSCRARLAHGKRDLERHLKHAHDGRSDLSYSCTLCNEPERQYALWEGYFFTHFLPAHFARHRRIAIQSPAPNIAEVTRISESEYNSVSGSAANVDSGSDLGDGSENDNDNENDDEGDDSDSDNEIDIDTDSGTDSDSSSGLEIGDELDVDYGSDSEDEEEQDHAPDFLNRPLLSPFHDEYGHMDENRRRKLQVLYHCLKKKEAEKDYVDLLKIFADLGVETEIFPSSFKALKSFGFRVVASQIIQIDTKAIINNNRVPVTDIGSIIRYWLVHPCLSSLTAGIAERHSVPYLASQNAMSHRQNEISLSQADDGIGALWTAPMWIETFAEQENWWREGFDRAVRLGIPVVPLHLLFFADDYDLRRRREGTFGCISVTLGEVPHGLRARLESPANAPVMIYDSEMKAQLGYDGFANYLRPQLERLARGQMIWSAHYRRPVLVIALVHTIDGDGPGRSAFMGFKTYSPKLYKPCHGCNITRDELSVAIRERRECEPRGEETVWALTRMRDFETRLGKDDPQTMRWAKAWGLNRHGAVFEWPWGYAALKHIAYDAAHMFAEGELTKFFQIITFICERYNSDFWKNFSRGLAAYNRVNHLASAGRLRCWKDWVQGLSMHAKLHSCLASSILFRKEDICPRQMQQERSRDLEIWGEFCDVVRVLTSHRIPGTEVPTLRGRVARVMADLVAMYEGNWPGVVTINSHYVTHLVSFALQFGTPREYWVFSDEQEIGGHKRESRLTNNRSLTHSVLRREWTRRCLALYLDPTAQFPAKFDYSAPGKVFAASEEFGQLCTYSGIQRPAIGKLLAVLPRATVNYLQVYQNAFVRCGDEVGKVEKLFCDGEGNDQRLLILLRRGIKDGNQITLGAERMVYGAHSLRSLFEGSMLAPTRFEIVNENEYINPQVGV